MTDIPSDWRQQLEQARSQFDFFRATSDSFRPFQPVPKLQWSVRSVPDSVYLKINDIRVPTAGDVYVNAATRYELTANIDVERRTGSHDDRVHEFTKDVSLGVVAVERHFEGCISIAVPADEIQQLVRGAFDAARIPIIDISNVDVRAGLHQRGRPKAIKIVCTGQVNPIPADNWLVGGAEMLFGIPEVEMTVTMFVGVSQRESIPRAYLSSLDVELDVGWWDRLRSLGAAEGIAELWESAIGDIVERLVGSRFLENICTNLSEKARSAAEQNLKLLYVSIAENGITLRYCPKILLIEGVITDSAEEDSR